MSNKKMLDPFTQCGIITMLIERVFLLGFITKTMIIWDDVFVTIWVGGQDKWSVLPEWENRIVKRKKFKGVL